MSSTTNLHDDQRPTRLEFARSDLGDRIVGLAERLRMLGGRVSGVRPQTDLEAMFRNYEWGYKMGRDKALTDVVRITTRPEAQR
ncbi:hypothetical protein V3N99_21785 [Dermatophilaceae bacterium Soc4.6]